MKLSILTLLLLITSSCSEHVSVDTVKEEVRVAERDFSAMAAKEGVATAFSHFAADDVVLLRGKNLIQGKGAMEAYFNNSTLSNVALAWEPEFIDVSNGGDMAYTYGQYQFAATGPDGAAIRDTGYFHTVWKRQKDGSWKFVWD